MRSELTRQRRGEWTSYNGRVSEKNSQDGRGWVARVEEGGEGVHRMMPTDLHASAFLSATTPFSAALAIAASSALSVQRGKACLRHRWECNQTQSVNML